MLEHNMDPSSGIEDQYLMLTQNKEEEEGDDKVINY